MEAYNQLKHKHKLFVDYYIKHGNGTKAYKEVYKENKNPRIAAHNLITKDNIKQAIEEKKQHLYTELNITEDDLKQVWKEILHDPDAKASDRLQCTQIVGKYLNIFKETPQNALILQFTPKQLECLDTDEDIIDVEHKAEF